jgi:hypothetical protein
VVLLEKGGVLDEVGRAGVRASSDGGPRAVAMTEPYRSSVRECKQSALR